MGACAPALGRAAWWAFPRKKKQSFSRQNLVDATPGNQRRPGPVDLANSDSATVFEISSTEYLKLKPSSVRKPGQTPLLLSLADLHKEDVVHVGIWRCLINSA